MAEELGATFTPAFDTALAAAPLPTLVYCAGKGGPIQLVGRDGEPGSLDVFTDVVRTNRARPQRGAPIRCTTRSA
ncbi:hypothetical protein GCM10010399_09360 [Dactylosporangium fulvum]|uniref:Uncharacterized protein n=1 Tax=Dactylosporangium fulvum TaxID=53359 RepID=A0ABY5WBN1_9ACTN|nr:hypothetical protein [Dactylosporangium fulvum]UWP86765.1 hypothetical protein Dfulv_21990 [Dactylosporangium fulvum]